MKRTICIFLMSFLLIGCSQIPPDSQPHLDPKKESLSAPEKSPTVKADYADSEEMNNILHGSNEGIIPVKLEIPAINVTAEIESVGILDNGEMGVPSSAEGVGWFEPGTKPGGHGNAVLAGHVDSRSGPAIFYNLGDLVVGDEVLVRNEKGETLTFIVKKIESYPRLYAPIHDIFGYDNRRQLNLITCTGTFNSEDRTHEERLVVYTEIKNLD